MELCTVIFLEVRAEILEEVEKYPKSLRNAFSLSKYKENGLLSEKTAKKLIFFSLSALLTSIFIVQSSTTPHFKEETLAHLFSKKLGRSVQWP